MAAAAKAMADQAGTDSRRAMGMMRIILNRHAVDLARATLTRWGCPTPPTTEDSSVVQQGVSSIPLHRQLQLHPSLYCLMATDDQAATMLHVVADAIKHEGLSGQTAEWLRWQARAALCPGLLR